MNERQSTSLSPGNFTEVFWVFLKLGVTSFGGPIAHLGYFQKELIEKRKWLNESQYSQLLAICQFLPGPASSQVGFCLGLFRAGWLGALSAFIAFTLPSTVLLMVFATALPMLSTPTGAALIHGLKLVACAVVADAVLTMAKKLCSDIPRKIIALASLILLMTFSSITMQLAVLIFAGIAGTLFIRNIPSHHQAHQLNIFYGVRLGSVFIAVFLILLLGLPILVWGYSIDILSVLNTFYRSGALVFGGGHVVLPLLESAVVEGGLASSNQFLAGYGAAQAIPGPLFSFAAYLGMIISPNEKTWLFACVALGAIFLPGFLLVAGALPFWNMITRYAAATHAIAGVNAAVVGLLAAALYNPIITSGLTRMSDLAIATVGFGLLAILRLSPIIVVAWCVFASVVQLWVL